MCGLLSYKSTVCVDSLFGARFVFLIIVLPILISQHPNTAARGGAMRNVTPDFISFSRRRILNILLIVFRLQID